VSRPIRIKFLSKTDPKNIEEIWAPLIPAEGFADVTFTFDANDEKYDFLVIYEGLPKYPGYKSSPGFERLSCARSNTLLITTEPSSIRVDGPKFLRQFGHILTNKAPELVRHPNQIRQTPPLRWFYGRPMDGNGSWMTSDEISQSSPEKKSNLSTVCSTKQMSHTVHAARLKFVMALKNRMPELEVFGRGIRPISDKSEAMHDYRYHIAIENHVEPGHWTEKLADCFLAECLPFYFGDPDYAIAFPKEAVIPIDILNIDEAENIIRKAIENDEYGKRRSAILEAKQRVLTEYNTLGWVANFVSGLDLTTPAEEEERIYNRHAFRQKYPISAVSDFAFRQLSRRKASAQPLQNKVSLNS
jgi:hypothetical protein